MTVATLITVAALPALWLMQRDSSSPGSGGVAVAGPSGGIAISGGGDDATTTTVITSTTAAGPAVALVTPGDPTAGETTTEPVSSTVPVGQRATGTATYKRYSGYGISNPCMAPRAPVNLEITVRSQNTGRSITCMNVVSYTALPDPDVVVVINTETFLQMADTSDAPVFVEVTW
jgi:hypothetical protein